MILYDTDIKIELKGTELYVNGHRHECSIRKLPKMREVLLSHVEAESEADFNVYYMYRSIYSSIEMRYDITFIPHRMLGKEFNKTYGHYHPVAGDSQEGGAGSSGLSYPEVYQVLRGSALFLLQKKNHDGSVNVLAIDAKEGEIALLPPNYGHVTINPSPENDLVLANIVFNGFESDYEEYSLNHGAAYYCTDEGLVQNTNYVVKNFERSAARDINGKYGFLCADLLSEFKANPEKFRFLEKPSLMFR